MRRPAALLPAVLLPAVLALAACGDAGEPAPEETGDLATLQAVQIEGEPGSEPTLSFDTPFQIDDAVAYVETEGDGDLLEEGDSATVHYVAMSGEDGELIGSTWELDQPEDLTIGDPALIGALSGALEGQRVGARIVYAAPGVEGETAETSAPATVMAIDVIDTRTVPGRASGTEVEPAEGLPTVTLAEDGAPTIDVEGAEEPDELVIQTLIEGDGPVVEQGQNITIHYHGVLLEDGEVFDSSWERGTPATFGIGVGQLIQGWDQGIPGQTVGSQVLLVIPSDLAYGDDDRPGIPGGSTLVFVVDILDAR